MLGRWATPGTTTFRTFGSFLFSRPAVAVVHGWSKSPTITREGARISTSRSTVGCSGGSSSPCPKASFLRAIRFISPTRSRTVADTSSDPRLGPSTQIWTSSSDTRSRSPASSAATSSSHCFGGSTSGSNPFTVDPTRTSAPTFSGYRSVNSSTVVPPIEHPRRCARRTSR